MTHGKSTIICYVLYRIGRRLTLGNNSIRVSDEQARVHRRKLIKIIIDRTVCILARDNYPLRRASVANRFMFAVCAGRYFQLLKCRRAREPSRSRAFQRRSRVCRCIAGGGFFNAKKKK